MIKSWLVIPLVAIAIAVGLSRLNTADSNRWFNRQRRPAWLTFERAIPAIWTFILICGIWSAYNVWEASPNHWGLMALYVLLETAIMLYTPSMYWFKNLRIGTIVGAAGWVIGLILAILVWPISSTAGFLLVPYLLWSPIGTYVTWEMEKLNP